MKVEIPDKLYFKISEVAKILGVEAYVLRFWESEFPMLAPKKTEGGHRTYRRKDLEKLLQIKELLYEKGFTISGAKKQLSRGIDVIDSARDSQEELIKIRQELEQILMMLKTKT